jgi:hypothetical protein
MLAKLREASIIFIMSVCLSVCPSVCLFVRMEQLGSHWADVLEFFLFEYFFEKLSKKFNFH